MDINISSVGQNRQNDVTSCEGSQAGWNVRTFIFIKGTPFMNYIHGTEKSKCVYVCISGFVCVCVYVCLCFAANLRAWAVFLVCVCESVCARTSVYVWCLWCVSVFVLGYLRLKWRRKSQNNIEKKEWVKIQFWFQIQKKFFQKKYRGKEIVPA